MRTPSGKTLWIAIAALAAGLAAASLVLTPLLALDPCHLCIFQRLLYMLMALLALAAAFSRYGWVAGSAVVPLAGLGAGVAGYQSWLQLQPPGLFSCAAAEPGLIERWVEWLGQQVPALFLATGFCEDEALVIMGLSLANWSAVSFAACFFVALAALRACRGYT